MSSTTYERRGGGGFLFILIFGVIIFLLAFGATQLDGILENLSDLPMTQHAAEGRAGTTMDADAIRRMIDNGTCKPVEFYICPPMNQSKAICYLKPTDTGDELWAGVLIGLQPPNKIITGYIAPYYEYWIPSIQRDGCREAIGE